MGLRESEYYMEIRGAGERGNVGAEGNAGRW